jgi:hypothetical protein
MNIIKETTTKITIVEIDLEIIKEIYNDHAKKLSSRDFDYDYDIHCLNKIIKLRQKKYTTVKLKRTMDNNDITWTVIGWSALNIGMLLNDLFEKLYQEYLRESKFNRILK